MGKDGRLVGHAIGLGGAHMLLHQDTVHALNTAPATGASSILESILLTGKPSPNQPEKYAIPSPAKFDSNSFRPPLEAAGQSLDPVKPQVGTSPFGVYKVVSEHPEQLLPTFGAPKLERDKNEFGTNCRAHGWSEQPSYGARLGGLQQFVDFPVKFWNCDPEKQGHCQLELDNRDMMNQACGGLADHGMPVLCGEEKKLTYLLKSSGKDASECSGQVEAYHVPHLVKDLEAALGGALGG